MNFAPITLSADTFIPRYFSNRRLVWLDSWLPLALSFIPKASKERSRLPLTLLPLPVMLLPPLPNPLRKGLPHLPIKRLEVFKPLLDAVPPDSQSDERKTKISNSMSLCHEIMHQRAYARVLVGWHEEEIDWCQCQQGFLWWMNRRLPRRKGNFERAMANLPCRKFAPSCDWVLLLFLLYIWTVNLKAWFTFGILVGSCVMTGLVESPRLPYISYQMGAGLADFISHCGHK